MTRASYRRATIPGQRCLSLGAGLKEAVERDPPCPVPRHARRAAHRASRAIAAEIDRAAVDFTTRAEIKWARNAAGTNEQAVLFGDPSKPLAGSCVIHYGGKVHYDGAEETIIQVWRHGQVWGMGPATSTPAEKH